jgi:hypothetical protein
MSAVLAALARRVRSSQDRDEDKHPAHVADEARAKELDRLHQAARAKQLEQQLAQAIHEQLNRSLRGGEPTAGEAS